ncbi:DNA alkylation repair protein [Mucilaginibacter sp. S1162]|uniref:DNA alkylation repair protein n=1 Tax=Mucilaginibacter humi TaxID=2732510 RepID=A0ABX1W0D4_9SPHI|nr:DNA alkylation repair protein [Mucilaginibacter humi]NNU33658.1 DNA alkylation repair protein [Mucilaginibacter humi]
MTVDEIMAELKARGDDKIKNILVKHGVKEPFFGVKVEYLKPIQKKVKKDYQLAKDLYATGNADAMYLAGLIADDNQMTTADLQTWVEQALSNNISEYTVPWVAAEGKYGFDMALKWIDAEQTHIAAAGWATLSNPVALKPDEELRLDSLKQLIDRVVNTIHSSPDRVRSAMNIFIISAGSYVTGLVDDAIAAANQIGIVTVDKNGTSCKVPAAVEYIAKAHAKGSLSKKKKTVKC